MKLRLLYPILFIFFLSCSKNSSETNNESIQLPTITTSAITNITQNTAVAGGNIISDGKSPITAKGVCWSTSPNPNLTNNKIEKGAGNGSFIGDLIELEDETTYYIKAYATNSKGTAYGEELNFKTKVKEPKIYDLGHVELRTQEEVDAFGKQGYTIIKRQLILGSSHDNSTITNLDSLKDLTEIGLLDITTNPFLPNIDGLINLKKVNGDLYITNNPKLTNLNGLKNIETIGGSLRIGGNTLIENIDSFNNITTIGVDLSISSNDNLTNIDGLCNIESVGGSLIFQNNKSLASISALKKLTRVYGNVRITGSIFKKINLEQLTAIGPNQEQYSLGNRGELYIYSNPFLTNIDGLNGITSLNGTITIWKNPELNNISGLQNLLNVKVIYINECNKLTNIDALSSITELGLVNISNNEILENIDGLQNLSKVISNVIIESNPALGNINGISNIIEIGNQLRIGIGYNPLVNNFCGLKTLITENPAINFGAEGNAYNPTAQDIIDGNCSE